MVETRLALEPEVQSILTCIDEYRNFLLSGGAGSGKTYSLVQVIRQVILENPTAKVACMTYTNAAVKEIEKRVNHGNLNVSTIHDFLWDNIKHFQKELRKALVTLSNDTTVARIKIDGLETVPDDYFDHLEDGIQYKEFLKLKEGIISHDELLIVGAYLFDKYPRLSDVVKDKYKFILIDEYQDTNKAVVEIFLNSFQKSKKNNVIGFFGDAMQSIYDDTIGNLDNYKGDEAGKVKEVKKEQNRRNPQQVINLANLIRTDGLTQVPSTDLTAPNMKEGKVRDGQIIFVYSTDPDFNRVKQYLVTTYGWQLNDPAKTKELNLTHNLIADKAEFRTLMDIYNEDQILKYRNRIKSYVKDNSITEDFSSHTFGEVIDFLKSGKSGAALNAVLPTAGMRTFIDANPDLYKIAIDYNYADFTKIYVDKDQLLDDKKQSKEEESKKGSKRDNLIKHLFKIQNNIYLYQSRQYNEFIRATDFSYLITSIKQKKILKENIEQLVNVGEKTVQEVIDEAHELSICIKDESLERFASNNKYLYDRVKDVKYKEFQKLYDYLEGNTPFSTKHKTKGSEFENVLVILDNGGWNNYNFKNLFLQTGTETVLARSQKIFYVCCTRAKENLAVFFHNPTADVIKKAKEWFGDANVISL